MAANETEGVISVDSRRFAEEVRLGFHLSRLLTRHRRGIVVVETVGRGTHMRTCVQKWGNSLAVRIPKAFADEIGLKKGGAVEVSWKDGKLVVTPAPMPSFTLEGLLSEVTRKNMHQEVDAGSAVGKEGW